ncbi:Rho-binding antiterminator [Photobacterium damselae]|uniref:Rho-binding antiterminator n=1 Tax=Photobacterium damselae TaxID=38293 RepID=UPI0037C349B9
MKEYQPIACQRYDYIEIACMHHYQITIELLDGTVIQGQAIDTKIENKQEFLLLDVLSKKEDSIIQVRLDHIHQLIVTTPNPQFTHITIVEKNE